MLSIDLGGDRRIKIGNDVFENLRIEFLHTHIPRAALWIRLADEQHIAALEHIRDDPRGASALGQIVLVKRQLGVAAADIENANVATKDFDLAWLWHEFPLAFWPIWRTKVGNTSSPYVNFFYIAIAGQRAIHMPISSRDFGPFGGGPDDTTKRPRTAKGVRP